MEEKHILKEQVKRRIDKYLEFDSSILFENCDYLEIFGGAVRDSITEMEIHDIDFLALSKSATTCGKILESKGYKLIPELNGKEIHEMYKEIHCIFEPWTFMNKNLKIIQIIRPAVSKEESMKKSIKNSDFNNKPVPNFNFINSVGFFDTMKQVDLSCCGVSYNGLHIRENCEDAILHCKNRYYSVNKNAKMYNQGRTISRESKLNDRGWTNIEFLKEEQLINLDRFKKLDKMLCESFVDL